MTQKISCVDGIAVGNFENIGGSEVVEGNLQHKPLFWFRSNTKTKTQNGQYFQANTMTSRNHISN